MTVAVVQYEHVLPTDARAPGKFRMITVEKAEGRWLDSRRSSPWPVPCISPFRFPLSSCFTKRGSVFYLRVLKYHG
jgi:hypothetical protein